MRFSSVFQWKALPPQPAKGPEQAACPPVEEEEVRPVPLAAVEPDLPDDLDARVRLVGEWQLGEG